METAFNEEVPNSLMTRRVFGEMTLTPSSLSTIGQYDFNRANNHVNVMNSMIRFTSSSMMTPGPSPDELIIQQRGRRKIPVTFSPDIDVIKQNKQESPKKMDASNINNSSIILRSTPRKRLLFNDPSELSSPEISSSITKKLRTEVKNELPQDKCLLSALKSLTSDQLIGIIEQIIINHPDVEEQIRSHFPIADLKPVEDSIYYLRRNINKALPTSRLVSKTDSMAYNKVSIHVMEFRKHVIDQGKRLVESKQWSIVMDYVFMAWKHVRSTPIWDIPSHNAARRQCFKSLSAFCMTALKHMKDTLNQQTCEKYKNQLRFLTYDLEDIELCLQLLN